MSERLAFGEFTVEPSLQRLTRNGEIVPLKPKAWDLLCFLLAHRNRVIDKGELLDWLWPRQDISESNLSQTIYELRRAIDDRPRNAQWIETVPRRGYCFVGDVVPVSDPSPGRRPRSVAVLPFNELGGNVGETDSGLGIADALITALSGNCDLVVRPLSAVMRYAESKQDALTIGGQLQVDSVLEGSLHSSRSGVRVTARLVLIADGTCLWADRFTTEQTDPLLVEGFVCDQVVQALPTRLTGLKLPPLQQRMTEDPEVHIACMNGWHCWHKWNVEAWLQAIRHFQAALKRQPGHAPSLAGLAAAWSTLGIFGASLPREAFANARRAATQAIDAAPDYSRGHEIMGAIHLFHDWNLPAAEECLDRAIEHAPDSCNARHLRALTLAAGGHDSPALAEIARAIRLDPQALIARTDVGYIHYWGRRYREAEQSYREVLELNPDFVHARHALAFSLAELGQLDQALREMRTALEKSGREPALSGELAWLLGRMGHEAEAERIASALACKVGQDYIDPCQLAICHIGLGDHDCAFEWLRRALHNRSRDLVLIPVNPVFDPIRSDDRYLPFLETAGLASLADR